tara:strand:+ start:5894 stop:6832 length:939 start_codon:yes stop_codon:yes gene_type:complete
LENYLNSLKILVLGGSGQIGSEIRAHQDEIDFSFSFPSSSELNLKNITSIRNYFSANTFDIVLNLAAYTSVDKAEEEKELSDKINHIGPEILAEETYKRNIGLIHVSTDYVFGKTGHGPYKSSDIKDPLNHYGHTKSLGEDKVLSIHDKSIIIRLASVFGNYGNNFVKTLTTKLLEDNDIRLVSDQLISLSYSNDFVKNLKEIILLYINHKNNNKILKSSIIHLTSPDYTNWFSVGSIIYDEIEKFTQSPLSVRLIPISSSEWISAAQRPLDTRLKVDYKFLKDNNIRISPWQDSVRLVVRNTLSSLKGKAL